MDGDTERKFALQNDKNIHRARLPFAKIGMRYGLRTSHNLSKLLIDPWAKELDRPAQYHPDLAMRDAETKSFVPRSVLSAAADLPFMAPRDPKWIYELPVRAFTMRHPDVPQDLRGTFAALTHPSVLKHFEELGVDTIEVMPLTAWIDERHLHAAGLRNAWGYNPISFMAPEPRLAPGGTDEIVSTLKILRTHGIQCVLDIVLNHSGEGDAEGPTLSFRGLDNETWYRHHNGALINDTGCGNTIDLTQPIVVEYVIDSLRHWISLGFAGFRFDLATVMGRTHSGFSLSAPLITAIEADPVLKQCVMIAEPWDIGPGGYQLGQFPKRWFEWNDRYRDDVRRFWRRDGFSANHFATRLAGSSDVFGKKSPSRSINFIAAHDGFTLQDLCIYVNKNNFANGEDNRDGKSDEVTCPGTTPINLIATLFLSHGTPMLTAGDEFGRTQTGNNNAYAQDNEITWLDWAIRDTNLETLARQIMRLRSVVEIFNEDRFFESATTQWCDADGMELDWSKPNHDIVVMIVTRREKRFAVTFNRSDAMRPFAVPSARQWTQLFPTTSQKLCAPRSVTLFVEG